MEKLIISACFLESGYKYDGTKNELPYLDKLKEKYEFIIVCPEVYGKLGVPRIPAERLNDLVINKNGEDVTKSFYEGSIIALEKVKQSKAKKALLKAKSPTCGKNQIYDGTFTHTLTQGNGVLVELLLQLGIEIYNENEVLKLL